MAGFEYRNTLSGTIPTPAKDIVAADAFWLTVKPGDLCKLDATGKAIASTATDLVHYGVVVAKEFIREKGDEKIIKVYIDRNAVYEAVVSAGAPILGAKHPVTADFKVNASITTTPSVQIQKILPGGTVLVSLL